MGLTITDCRATTSSITIFFSDPVDHTSTGPASTNATNPNNYTVFDPDSTAFATPDHPPSITVGADGKTVTIPFAAPTFNPGDSVLVVVTNIALATNPGTPALEGGPVTIAREVPGKGGIGRITRDVEDAIAYPILTEEVGLPPSAVAAPMTGVPGAPAGGLSLGQVAARAVTDALGWKVNASDPKGFVGALTQSFTLTEVEGHTEATWVPRTYAVQTDLGGGITGAQASLYSRAKDALDKSLPLLDGLYPLDPEADPEYVKALREMARSQMSEIVKELGALGGPSVLRVNTYFQILLGQTRISFAPGVTKVEFNPDRVKGTLGSLRDTYGIFFTNNPLSNSIEDEQDITNFRVISDYMTSLLQSWISNGQFFVLGPPSQPAFYGTQLVLISRQFSVITETVNEVRFALDSVFIGPSERQTLLLEFSDGSPPMFLEDILQEVANFAADEGPRLLRDGGRIAVTNNILPVVQTLENLVEQAHDPVNINHLPDGFRTVRVRNALDDLDDQLTTLSNLVQQVGQIIPVEEPPAAALQNVVTSLQQPNLLVLPPGLDFGSVETGESSAPQTVTLLNFSSQITFDSVSMRINTGPNAADFVLGTSTCTGALGPLRACAVSVTFTPTDTDSRSATLTVTAEYKDAQGNLQTQTATLSLSGTGSDAGSVS